MWKIAPYPGTSLDMPEVPPRNRSKDVSKMHLTSPSQKRKQFGHTKQSNSIDNSCLDSPSLQVKKFIERHAAIQIELYGIERWSQNHSCLSEEGRFVETAEVSPPPQFVVRTGSLRGRFRRSATVDQSAEDFAEFPSYVVQSGCYLWPGR